MKKTFVVHCVFLALLAVFCFDSNVFAKDKPLEVKIFHSPRCKACIKTIHEIIPVIAEKYSRQVQWQYYDITRPENYPVYLELKKMAGRPMQMPAILVNQVILIGINEIADSLSLLIQDQLLRKDMPLVVQSSNVSALEYFKGLGPLAVVGAGLIDGVNPCAFTVVVFFISFLSVMGYRRREMVLIGSAYIFAVFVTYLILGFGFFKAFYNLKAFYVISKVVYLTIGGVSLFLGCLAVNDYLKYRKTKNTDDMALGLPPFIKNKIHNIVGAYYRKDKNARTKSLLGLVASALVVGFMISMLEAVCTGQIYLPTIIFVLKNNMLQTKALFYLILYNLMFILPLIIVFILALTGTSSGQFEAFARRHLGLIKILMAAVFYGLGLALWLSA